MAAAPCRYKIIEKATGTLLARAPTPSQSITLAASFSMDGTAVYIYDPKGNKVDLFINGKSMRPKATPIPKETKRGTKK